MNRVGFWQMFRQEWRHILSRRAMLIIAVLAPLLYGGLLGAVYSQHKVVAIPFVVVDADNSALSREIIQGVQQSEYFRFAGYANSPNEFKHLALRDRAKFMLVFPQHFSRDVKRGRGAKIQALIDNSNMAIGNVALQTISSIGSTYAVGVDVARSMASRGEARTAAMSEALPLDSNVRALNNPAFNQNYANFVLLGLVGIAIQLIPLLMTLETTAVNTLGRRSVLVEIFAKWFAYVVITVPVSMLAMRLAISVVQASLLGSMAFVMWFTVFFSMVMCMVGVGFSILIHDPQRTLGSFAVIAMPSFLVSGFTWPASALPAAIRVFAAMLPITHYAEAIRRNHLMGLGFTANWGHIWPLLVWAVLGLVAGIIGCKRNMKLYTAGARA